jgi:hypothetical protein
MALLSEEGPMRKLILAVLLGVLVGGRPAAAAVHTQGEEAGYAIAAATLTLVYLPVKTLVAIGGLAVGAATGFLTGGNTRAAYAIWVPAAGGTYFLTPSQIAGTRPIEFFGADYIDRPSRNVPDDRTTAYEAVYVP